MTDETTTEVAENTDQAPVDAAPTAIENVATESAPVAETPSGPPVIIRPSIGRVVLFRPDAAFVAAKGLSMIDTNLEDAQPLSAQIVYVHDDYTINLGGFDQYGYLFTATRVPLLTGNETEAPVGPYAHWMNHQLTQALKERA